MSDKFIDLVIILWLIMPFALAWWFFTQRPKRRPQSFVQSDLSRQNINCGAPDPRNSASSSAAHHDKTAIAILAAAGAFFGVLALEIVGLIALAEMTGSRPPRGSPLFLLPAIAAGMWAWRPVRSGPRKAVTGNADNWLKSLNREGRLKLVLSALWVGLLCIYWVAAKPYRYTHGAQHTLLFLLWLTVPPLIALGALKALQWASQGEQR